MKAIEIEVFRADTKASRGITSADIAELATSYNADENPVPAVIGHPKSDSPAHGVIEAFRADGNKLFATIKDFSDELVDGFKKSKFLNRSMAFFGKDHEANPTPGKLAPRHLGFLGGSAPGIPGMSSLKKALSFSADEDMIVVDGAPAQAVLFEAEPTPVFTVQEERKKMPQEKTQAELDAEFAAREQKIKDYADALKARETEFAAREAKAHKTACEARVDALVAGGKVMPANRDALALVFSALSTDELEFSAEDKGSAADKLAKILSEGPALVDVSGKQLSPKDKFTASTGNVQKDADTITARARQLIKDEPGLTFEAAVERISEEA